MGKLSNGWTDWHQLWSTSADSSGNGHRLNTIRPTIPQGGIWGGLEGQQFKTGKCGQTARPLGMNVAHVMQMNLGMHTIMLNKLAP